MAEAHEALVDAWYDERQRRRADPTRRRSAMTTEHHRDRIELNRRARERLVLDGTLHGPELRVADAAFQAGDEVVARVADRELRAEGAPRDAYVRNGSVGTVAEVRPDGLVVDFERLGRATLPLAYLGSRRRAGHVAALEHAYARTTYGAQGETYAAAAPLVSDASSREGLYVALTRPQHRLDAVIARTTWQVPEPGLPALEDETGALEATERHLAGVRRSRLGLEHRRMEEVDDQEHSPRSVVHEAAGSTGCRPAHGVGKEEAISEDRKTASVAAHLAP